MTINLGEKYVKQNLSSRVEELEIIFNLQLGEIRRLEKKIEELEKLVAEKNETIEDIRGNNFN